MAVGAGSLIEITLAGQIFSQQWMNVWTYRVVGEIGSPTVVHYANAWWDRVKATYRPLIASVHGAAFLTIAVREMDDPAGEYGVWAIPAGENAGTATTGAGGVVPPFVALAVRFTVATRATRPGQKRVPGQDEGHLNNSTWESAYVATANAWATVMEGHLNLNAPALGTEIAPVVVRKNPATGLPVAHQDITGHIVNGLASSQVSRKIGHGA